LPSPTIWQANIDNPGVDVGRNIRQVVNEIAAGVNSKDGHVNQFVGVEYPDCRARVSDRRGRQSERRRRLSDCRQRPKKGRRMESGCAA
jgi:hypothetical protein